MPSPPLLRRRESSPPARWLPGSAAGLAALALLAAAGCAGRPEPQAPSPRGERHPIATEDRPFLLDPIASFSFRSDGQRAEDVAAAFRRLLDEGAADEAAATAEALLAVDPRFQPAVVLAAQADFARRRFEAAAERLEATVRQGPESTAARLLLARVREALGDLVGAYTAYREMAEASPAAGARAEELRPRAAEIVANRFAEALRQGRLEEASAEQRLLAGWEPEGTAAWFAARELAAAQGDARAELQALSHLASRLAERPDLVERRADLELELGDPGVAVDLYQRLAEEGDATRLEPKLARAKFRWRLALLPAEVQALAERPTLTRSGFATLLFWLVPEVRYGRPGTARIAGDILEHPQREAIARVVNLGLMDIDPTLHLFAPGGGLGRLAALRALLGVAKLRGGVRSCAGGAVPSAAAEVCAAAARCRLVADAESCLPRAAMAGPEAVEMIRVILSP